MLILGQGVYGRFAAMWGSVLPLALLVGLDPLRLGWTLLVVSRPRPAQNLFAYWVGTVIVSVPALALPLTLLHVIPRVRSFTQGLATNSIFLHIQTGIGVLLLSVAALMTVRSLTRRRQRAQLSAPAGTTSTLVLDSDTPTAVSPHWDREQDTPTNGVSAFRRLLDRARNAWESGSWWVSLVIGMGCMPPPEWVLITLAIAVTSGASIGTQVSVAVVFVIGMLAIVEILLVGYLVIPTKTQKVLRVLHDWSLAHRRQVVLTMLAVAGVSLVTHGVGGV